MQDMFDEKIMSDDALPVLTRTVCNDSRQEARRSASTHSKQLDKRPVDVYSVRLTMQYGVTICQW